MKFTHEQLTDAGFVKDPQFPNSHFYDHPDGRSVDAKDGQDLWAYCAGIRCFVGSLDQLRQPLGDPSNEI